MMLKDRYTTESVPLVQSNPYQQYIFLYIIGLNGNTILRRLIISQVKRATSAIRTSNKKNGIGAFTRVNINVLIKILTTYKPDYLII